MNEDVLVLLTEEYGVTKAREILLLLNTHGWRLISVPKYTRKRGKEAWVPVEIRCTTVVNNTEIVEVGTIMGHFLGDERGYEFHLKRKIGINLMINVGKKLGLDL